VLLLSALRSWKDIKDVTGQTLNFPLIGDPDKSIANAYDMIHPNASGRR
jgi:alkyl hydroperoxide reductase subunit AhpC